MGFWNVLFPKNIKCIVCSEELPQENSFSLCQHCISTLPFINDEICLKCGNPLKAGKYCLNCKRDGRHFEAHRSVFVYSGGIISVVQNYKYSNAKYLAPYLGNLLVDKFLKVGWEVDMVIAVPLHSRREKERGFNQAFLMARQFEKIHLPINTTALLRTKHLSQQAILTRKERITNLKECFKVADKKAIQDKTILLIDDIFTTGNTIDICASTLLKGGAKKVYALTICKGVLESNF